MRVGGLQTRLKPKQQLKAKGFLPLVSSVADMQSPLLACAAAVALFACCLVHVDAALSASQLDGLASLRDATNGGGWSVQWPSLAAPCSLAGITCSSDGNRVM